MKRLLRVMGVVGEEQSVRQESTLTILDDPEVTLSRTDAVWLVKIFKKQGVESEMRSDGNRQYHVYGNKSSKTDKIFFSWRRLGALSQYAGDK